MTGLFIAVCSLWFYADFDRPFIVDGRVYDVPMRQGKTVDGKFGHGYSFVSKGRVWKGDFLCISEHGLLDGFPSEEGSFSCFYRLPDGCEKPKTAPFWGYGGLWQFQWGWTGDTFYTENGNNRAKCVRIKPEDWEPTRTWRHFCATWSADEIVCYCDGRRVASRKNPTRADLRTLPRRAFWLGSKGDGSSAANLEADEVAIFRKALRPDEVRALAESKKPLVGEDEFIGGFVDFPIFWRNQKDAAIRMKLLVPRDGVLTAALKVGGRSFAPRSVPVRKGLVRFAAPFDPAVFRSGEYPWTLTIGDSDGKTLFKDSGTLEIRGRVERDAFKFLSWGGPTVPAVSNLVAAGLNAANNIKAGERDQVVRDYLRNDIFVNYRLENSKDWEKLELDPRRIAKSAAKWLEPGIGLHLWATTLVNSEVYLKSMQDLTNGLLAAQCKAALGHDPDISLTQATWEEFDYDLKGIKPYRGIMPDDDRTLRTRRWYRGDAFKACQMNRASAEAIRRLSPGNVVWSEPNPPPAGLDMLAAWVYDYESERVMVKLRRQRAWTRAKGVRNMPTLGMCYFSPMPPHPVGAHPTQKGKDGNPLKVKIAQSCDELMIKSWMALGGVRCDALSYYEFDTWERGAAGTRDWQADPGQTVKFIGETDAIGRFGEFVRNRLAPAAELLRGLEEERLPIGVVQFDETDHAGGWKWSRMFFLDQIEDALTRLSLDCDHLCADELNAKTLSSYRYLILPMHNVVTASHDAMLRALPSSVKLITDAHAVPDYPNAVRLADLKYAVTTKDRGPGGINRAGADDPLRRFFADKVESLHALRSAWSESDGRGSYTLTKALGGVKFVTVVNDARRTGGSPMNLFNTNAWYRPCGAPRRIVTHFNVPGVIYEFNAPEAGGPRKGRTVALDYAAAEGRVFCVYPRPLTGLALDVRGKPERGSAAEIGVRVTDARGAAPGRQVVRLSLTDSTGRQTDESGLYAVEGGECRIPVRFAQDDPADGVWRARAVELTTGLEKSLEFRVE